MASIEIESGFGPKERMRVAELYWDAFGAKLALPLGPSHRAVALLSNVVDPQHCLVARREDREIIGIAGFKTNQGQLLGITAQNLVSIYGSFGAIWRGILLAFLDRPLTPGVLLMDGICVAKQARGLGVGTALLDAVIAQAQQLGLAQVCLSVIDTNPRAKALYERRGFVAHSTSAIPFGRWIFGFSRATEMIYQMPQRSELTLQ